MFVIFGVVATVGRFVEEPSEVPGHSVGDLDAKTEVGRNLGLRATEM